MPVYKKIMKYIEECIKGGVYSRGGAIPSEQEFCTMFDCSRMTVRKALDELVSIGILYKAKGKGAFVSNIEYDRLYSLKGFSQIMRQQGLEYSSEVVRFEIMPAQKDLANKLRILEGMDVYCLERIRKVMGDPVSIETVNLNMKDFPGLLNYDFSRLSLYEIMESEYGVSINRAVQSINTVNIDGENAKILFNKNKGVALRSMSIGYNKSSRPIEYEYALYNGYKYTVDVIIRGEN